MVAELRRLYEGIRPQIQARLAEFRKLWEEGTEEDLFAELVFCLLTPQAKGKAAWETVLDLRARGLLLEGSPRDLIPHLRRVRFHRKAEYIVQARAIFCESGMPRVREKLRPLLDDPFKARAWLVARVKGMGYKEASHFLRNIGFGEHLAILDRHILRNLMRLRMISELPTALTPKRYLQIEARMRIFAKAIDIPLSHLDLLFWYLGTGEIFK